MKHSTKNHVQYFDLILLVIYFDSNPLVYRAGFLLTNLKIKNDKKTTPDKRNFQSKSLCPKI